MINGSQSPSRRGVALLAVLAFVLLLTILIVSYISYTTLNRLSTASYSRAVQAQEIANGGLQDIISDLKMEIVAGSLSGTAYSPATGPAIYVPASNKTATPARLGYSVASWGQGPTTSANPTSAPSTLLPSLIRVSRASATAGATTFNPVTTIVAATFPNLVAVPGGAILNRASQVSSGQASVDGRFISPTRWNKSFLLASSTTLLPTPFYKSTTTLPETAYPATPDLPDWVYVTRNGSRVCTLTEVTSGSLSPTASPTTSYTITPGSIPPAGPVIGRYAFIIYDEGALLDANIAGSTTAANTINVAAHTNVVSSPADTTTGMTMTINSMSTEASADLTQLPGMSTGTATIDTMIGLRNASVASTGNGYLVGLINYLKTGFLTVQSGDSPFLSRQDLINYFTKIDPNINTTTPASATFSLALPFLGTCSRAVSAPSYTPPIDSQNDPNYHKPSTPTPGLAVTAPVAYKTNAETTGSVNRDLANVRFSASATVTHYFDDQSASATIPTSTYKVNAGDPLLQNRFSLAKINWLSQADPNAGTAPSGNYPAAIQAAFGLVWGSPGSTTTNSNTSSSTANGGNPCWNYVGSPAGTGATAVAFNGTIETLDQVAAEGREPNFFELLKASILNGSLGLGPGKAQFANGADNTVASGFIAPFDAKFGNSAADLYGGGSLFSSTFGPASSIPVQWTIPDIQIIQIGANIIDQYDADSYPTAIYFNYAVPGAGSYPNNPNDPVTGSGATVNAIFGPVSMVYGDENLPLLNRVCSVLASPNPITTSGSYDSSSGPTSSNDDNTHSLEGWLQPEIWNPHQQPAAALTNVPHNFQIRAYGSASTYVNENGGPVSTQALSPTATTTPDGWTPSGPTGLTAGSTSPNWAVSASQPQFYWTGTSSTETATGPAEQAGTINFTDTSGTSSLYMNPRLLVRDGDASTVSIPGLTNVNSPLPLVSSTFGTVSGDYLPTSTTGHIPYYDATQSVNTVAYTNHFVGFTTGVISETNGGTPYNPFYVGSNYATNAGLGFVASTAGVSGASFAMGWLDTSSRFHPYSFVTGAFVQAHLNMYNDAGHPPDGRIGGAIPGEQGPLSYGNVDPRTGRFFVSNNFVTGGGANQNSTMFPNNDLVYAGEAASEGGIPSTGNFTTPAPSAAPNNAYPQDWAANSTILLTIPTSWTTNDGRRQTTTKTPAYYADPDGVVRPGDGLFGNVATGDGLMLFTSNGTSSTALGDRLAGTGSDDLPMSTTNSSGNTRHGRRPVILNRPFRNVGELGYVFRDQPFKTLDFFERSSADAALLDVFSLVDEAKVNNNQLTSVIAGQVDLSNAPYLVIKSLVAGGAKKDVDPAYNITKGALDAQNLATAIANNLSPTSASPNPLMNRAALVTQLMPILQGISGTTLSPTTFTSNTADDYNKAYLESTVRALSDPTSTRTWNLMIDIIAQSGQMSPTATTLSNFVVQGERRYWLHVSIDRYTGKVVAQQLEPVYE